MRNTKRYLKQRKQENEEALKSPRSISKAQTNIKTLQERKQFLSCRVFLSCNKRLFRRKRRFAARYAVIVNALSCFGFFTVRWLQPLQLILIARLFCSLPCCDNPTTRLLMIVLMPLRNSFQSLDIFFTVIETRHDDLPYPVGFFSLLMTSISLNSGPWSLPVKFVELGRIDVLMSSRTISAASIALSESSSKAVPLVSMALPIPSALSAFMASIKTTFLYEGSLRKGYAAVFSIIWDSRFARATISSISISLPPQRFHNVSGL